MRSILLKTASSFAVVCAMTGSLLAADGVQIVEKTTSGDTAHTSQVQIEKNRMRTEMTDAAGAKQVMIFDGVKQVMYMINVDRKTYSEVTKADFDRLGGQMQDAMGQMQAAMANMTPAQREQMAAMMRGRMGAAMAPAKTEYKKTGADKVGRWTCDKYEGSQNGQKTSELCTVEPGVLGFAAGDLEVMQQFGAFFQKLMPQGGDRMFTVGRAEDQGFSGIPVRRISTVGGKPTTMEVTDVSRQSFAESMFAVPVGFQKEEFAMGRGRGR